MLFLIWCYLALLTGFSHVKTEDHHSMNIIMRNKFSYIMVSGHGLITTQCILAVIIVVVVIAARTGILIGRWWHYVLQFHSSLIKPGPEKPGERWPVVGKVHWEASVPCGVLYAELVGLLCCSSGNKLLYPLAGMTAEMTSAVDEVITSYIPAQRSTILTTLPKKL